MSTECDTLLIIDDNPEDREFLRHALCGQFQIIEAELGVQGLALIETARPACVLLDYFLPDMDGLELLAARGSVQEDDYGLIVLTGSDEVSLAVACMKQGAHDFLIKGRFNPHELRRTITGSLEKLSLRRALRDQQLALQASEQRLALFIEHAPASLAMFDDQLCYLAASRRWLNRHGVNEADIQGRCHLQLFPDTPESWRTIYRRGLAGEVIRAEADCLTDADGQKHWLRWEVRPWYDAGGQIGGILVFTEDLTALKQAEQASRAKNLFLANMSHELRTPFDAVIGLLQLLEQSHLDERQRDYVDKAQQSARSLLNLLADLLDVSRIEAGKLELEEAPFSLHGLIAGVVALFSPTARAKGLILDSHLDPELADIWIGDRARLLQILTNLVSNAVKFTSQGAIRIRVEPAEPAGVRLHVTDQGIGIAPEHLGVIFDSFQQLDPSLTRRLSGTGLGLAICKGLVGRLGGEIQVESTPGVGSRFSVVVPLRPDPAPGRAAPPVAGSLSQRPASAPPNLNGLRLLVAEDSEVNRFVAQEMLSQLGAQVEVAEHGEAAVRLALEAEPGYDLILMDLQMPVLNGLEASRRLRATPRTRALPMLAMTANVRAADRLAAEQAGMSGFLAKPIDWLAAAGRILELCGHRDDAPAPWPDRQAASTALPHPPGFDLPGALERLDGARPIYCAMAKRFLDIETAIHRDLMAHLDQNDRTAAIKVLHPVRGTALSLGALALAEAMHALEQALRAPTGADVTALIAQLETRWHAMRVSLRQIIAEFEPP
jgi:PAS domain S-box-containing protein